ncbi:glycosyltransferase [Paenibacillus polysaccharolyticus]|uniref:glycosyltransferase n=1 Tax=Paenibacillus polysaccharolyticus TaxID=582692 RepID=UPI00204184FD|nr:glycosyltransferase [Paenibacillus polysaccharolyticus]MCM3135338.1 glycosyltransferase [Paenibacillus polysaccharolyticus]
MENPTVYMLPKMIENNKFNELLSGSIENKGWEVKQFTKKNLLRLKKNDIVHFHWPSFYYRGSSVLSTTIKAMLYVLMIAYARLRGVKLFWTVHNIWPHNSGKTRFDYWMRKILVANCVKLIVMGKPLIPEICSTFGVGEDRIEIIPHGHYKGVYKGKGTDIRSRFGIPKNSYVYGFFGQVSPYKGVDDLLDAFEGLQSEQAHLLIAGKKVEKYELDTQVLQSGKVHTHFHFIEDDEYSDYFAAVDSIILPYKQIATSGSAILALSFGKPVVAPRIGLLEEYLPDDCAVLYDPADPDGLIKAMHLIRMKQSEYEEGSGFVKALERLDWPVIAQRTLTLYSG